MAALLPERHKAQQDAWNEAVSIVHHRRMHDTPTKRAMIEVAERYNNSVMFALPEVEEEPTFPPLAATIIGDAIDSNATRANDTWPILTAPARNPNVKGHRKAAMLRRHAWSATWGESQLPLRLGRAYRQLNAYATFCLAVEPDHEAKRARIVTRNPLLAYPEPMDSDEVRAPRNVGFIYGRSPSQLKKMYPEIATYIDKNTSTEDDIWDILDWTDEDWNFIGLLGKRGTEVTHRHFDQTGRYTVHGDMPSQAHLLRAFPNRAGMVPVVCPQQVTLDRQMSAINRIVPITDVLNKLAAMHFISGEKALWPHIFVLGENGEEPQLLGGGLVDSRTGEVNRVTDVRDVQALTLQPSPSIQTLMSDLERNARLASGNPALYQGELSGSVRSGQTISQLAAAAIDPRLKEAHNTMSYALKVINEAVARTEMGYWPRRTYTVFSDWPGTNRHVTYSPHKVWDEKLERGSMRSAVTYPMPGLDAQGATIVAGQLVQGRMISRRTARQHHPLVSQMDPDSQDQEIMEEAVDDAISMTMVQLISSGQMAVTDLAKVRGKVREGMNIEDAIAEVQEEAQQRQAQEPAPPEPGMMAPPESMPGINAPGAGGEAPLPQPPGESPGGPAQLEALMGALMASPGGGPGAP